MIDNDTARASTASRSDTHKLMAPFQGFETLLHKGPYLQRGGLVNAQDPEIETSARIFRSPLRPVLGLLHRNLIDV